MEKHFKKSDGTGCKIQATDKDVLQEHIRYLIGYGYEGKAHV